MIAMTAALAKEVVDFSKTYHEEATEVARAAVADVVDKLYGSGECAACSRVLCTAVAGRQPAKLDLLIERHRQMIDAMSECVCAQNRMVALISSERGSR